MAIRARLCVSWSRVEVGVEDYVESPARGDCDRRAWHDAYESAFFASNAWESFVAWFSEDAPRIADTGLGIGILRRKVAQNSTVKQVPGPGHLEY